MKKISEHLSQIIVALAAVALILSTLVVVGPSVSDFFGDMVNKEIYVGLDMIEGMEVAQAEAKGLVNVRDQYEYSNGYISTNGELANTKDSNYKYVRVPVQAGEEWAIWYSKFSIFNKGSGVLRFENSSKNLVSTLEMSIQPQYKVNPQSNTNGILVEIPDGVSYMCVKLKFASSWDETESAIIAKYNNSTKLAFIGDSITHGIYDGSTTPFAKLASESLGVIHANNGVHGSGYVDYHRFAIDKVPSNADVIVVYGSFNDMYGKDSNGDYLQIGTATDVYVEGEENSIAANINYVYDYLQTNYPNAKIAAIAPAPWGSFNPDGTTSQAIRGQNYVNVLEEICESRGIEFFDLYRTSGLKPWTDEHNNAYFIGDACHPNTAGHEIIADKITPFLRRVINSK